jgi:hypothetical protein
VIECVITEDGKYISSLGRITAAAHSRRRQQIVGESIVNPFSDIGTTVAAAFCNDNITSVEVKGFCTSIASWLSADGVEDL